MYRLFKSLFFFSFLLLLPIFLTSAMAEEEKKIISTTMSPYDFFVKKIAGDLVETNTLIPAFADHETFEPGIAKISKIAKSDLFIAINPKYFSFEKKIENYFNSLKDNKTIFFDSSSNVELYDEDPHIWTSPEKVKLLSNNIFTALLKILPDKQTELKNNLDKFLQEINNLQAESIKQLAQYKGRTFFSYHKSWSYFASEYQLRNEQIENEGKEPNLVQQNNLIKKLKANNAKLIILENPNQSEKVTFLKSFVDFETITLNAQEENWIENQRKLIQTLLKSFN